MTDARADQCRVCGNTAGNTRFGAREMMFGTRDTFDYVECAGCGCLQIVTPPTDLARYYPSSYYSLAEGNGNVAGLRGRLNAIRVAHLFGEHSLAGRLLTAWRGFSPDIAAVARLALPHDAAVLDIGCGRGDLLRKMAAIGFTRLRGVDPFIANQVRYPDGVFISNDPIETLDDVYDVVMLHHSLEHMPDQHAALREVRRLLAPRGVAVVRIPVADSNAWRIYQSNWVQLDAPRHLVVHTRRSMEILADQAGLEVVRVVYDSTAFQFWASELYQHDISLYSDRSGTRLADPQLPRSEMRRYERKARELNEQELGDQACFYLRARATA